mmetsp:Transcript_86070/g.240660  ORF Transcript_86070/g.240660 Transcript_86070/m.240660 type:complete len:215 (-) Transcript_86070:1688-2332(-)
MRNDAANQVLDPEAVAMRIPKVLRHGRNHDSGLNLLERHAVAVPPRRGLVEVDEIPPESALPALARQPVGPRWQGGLQVTCLRRGDLRCTARLPLAEDFCLLGRPAGSLRLLRRRRRGAVAGAGVLCRRRRAALRLASRVRAGRTLAPRVRLGLRSLACHPLRLLRRRRGRSWLLVPFVEALLVAGRSGGNELRQLASHVVQARRGALTEQDDL